MSRADADHTTARTATPSLRALFSAFLKIGLLGFGGVAAFARHVIVVERGFLDERGFAELFGVCSTLPGANTVNLSIMLGDRYRGPLGAAVAVTGLMGAPLAVLVAVAALYERFGAIGWVRAGLAGAAAAAAGLVLGTALKILRGLEPDAVTIATAAAVCLAAALARLPMPLILAVAIPASLGVAAMRRRARQAQGARVSALGQLVRTFALLSLLSIGGANATVPEIHRQVVTVLHWMDDATFAKLIAIGQTAPGPNVLIVGMVGWQVAGVAGMVAATLAMILPAALLALAIGRAMARYAALEWIGLTRRALAPIAVGFMLASGIVMTQASYTGAASLAIVAGVAALVYLTRASPFWGIAAGAMIGITGYVILGTGP